MFGTQVWTSLVLKVESKIRSRTQVNIGNAGQLHLSRFVHLDAVPCGAARQRAVHRIAT